jgi:hypothetical protein
MIFTISTFRVAGIPGVCFHTQLNNNNNKNLGLVVCACKPVIEIFEFFALIAKQNVNPENLRNISLKGC